MVMVGGQTSNARSLLFSGTTCPVLLGDILGGGSPGDVLVLEGTGFDAVTPSKNLVVFSTASGTVAATVLQAGGIQLHVRIPDGAVQGIVTVTEGGKTSDGSMYTPP